jgi:hypothetical protein
LEVEASSGSCWIRGWARLWRAGWSGHQETGYRWRAEFGGVVPLRGAEAVRSNRYLAWLEWQRIAAMRAQGAAVGKIA